MIRFPKGRATQRVVNDILVIADSMDTSKPVALTTPITDEAIADMFNEPAFPEPSGTGESLDNSFADSGPQQLEQPDTASDLPGMVLRGDNLADGL